MTVSILIPAYNASATLPQLLDTLRLQTRQADEIIVCDDGSAESPSGVLAAYPEVRLVHQAHGGLSKARNTLLDAATGDIVIFADADDTVLPRWIEVLAGSIERTGADISVCGILAGKNLDERRYTWPCTGDGVIRGDDFYRLQLRHPAGVYSYLPIVAMRRELLFVEPRVRGVLGLQAHEDEVFLLQVAKKAGMVATSDECLYNYIYYPTSLCAVYMRKTPTARVRYQYFLKDWSKFRISGRPLFAIKAMRNLTLAGLRHFLKGEVLA
jgi:heptose III glucuronosyltransferase